MPICQHALCFGLKTDIDRCMAVLTLRSGPSNLWHKEGLLTMASGKSFSSKVRLGQIRLGLAR